MGAKTLCKNCHSSHKLNNFDGKGNKTPKTGYHCSYFGKRMTKQVVQCEHYKLR